MKALADHLSNKSRLMKKNIDQFCADTYNEFFSIFDGYNKRLISILNTLLESPPQVVLDLGCGTGLSTLALGSCFPKTKVLGVDIDAGMIASAKSRKKHPNLEFHCSEILEIIAKTPDKTVDLIFVKSAYHYFDKQITLDHLKPLLRENGAIVIVERTARSARSYALPEIASNYWESVFEEPRPSRRLENSSLFDMPLTVSCYGEQVSIPTEVYVHAAKENQLVGLWMLKPEVISTWIEDNLSQGIDVFRVFEEHWLYIYRNI